MGIDEHNLVESDKSTDGTGIGVGRSCKTTPKLYFLSLDFTIVVVLSPGCTHHLKTK